MFTEAQLRGVFEDHWPSATSWYALECSCSKWAGTSIDGQPQYKHLTWSIDHFMECLKEAT